MYFVINCFISAVCIISLILFTEVFPKWTKLLVGAVQVVTTSYAIAILIKKSVNGLRYGQEIINTLIVISYGSYLSLL